MANKNIPIPQDKIGENFVWRDWFQKLSNRVYGTISSQDSNNVDITGGVIQATSVTTNTLYVPTGTDGQVLIGKTSDHSFTPATLTAGTNITITNAPGSITIAGSGATTGDVFGPASATDNAVARFNTTTGKLIQDSVVIVGDTGDVSGVLSQQFSNGSATTLAAGKMWYDGTTGSWNMGMGNGNITQQVGEELFIYGKASAAITDSPLQIVYHTGTVGASGALKFAPTVAGITDVNAILGIATENIALNGFGRITTYGVVHGITTNGTAFGETWADDDVIWYNPVTGNPTKVEPVAPNIKVQVGLVINAGSGGSGSFQVGVSRGSKLGGTDSNVQFSSLANNNLIAYDSTLLYWKNVTASAIGLGTVTSVTGTSPVSVATGTTTPVISLATGYGDTQNPYTSKTANFVLAAPNGLAGVPTFRAIVAADIPTLNQNTTGSAATLTTGRTISITGDLAYTSTSFNGSANVTAAGTLATVNLNVGSFTNASLTVNGKGLITAASSGTAAVTSVTGTSPVASSGGTTPAISLSAGYGDTLNPYASKTANFILAAPTGLAGVPTFRAVVAADIPTLNQNTTGSAATLTTGRTIAITGDLTYTSTSFNGSANVTAAGTLATVNTNVGSFTNATLTVNGKGLITAASSGTAPVTSVTGTAPVVSSGGTTPAISMPAATTLVSGYLTSTDWTTFNNKGSGTVTSVAATVPSFLSVAGSPITTSGTLAITLSGTALPVVNGGTGLTTTPANGALDIGNGTGFTRTTLTAGSGISVTNSAGGISIANTSPSSGGTVTSVAALTLGTTGTDLSSTVANSTTTPVITLNVPTASATNRGALSSADWTTFNNKGSGTVTSVTGTSPVVSSGGTTPAISLATAYGDTLNPYASKTANFVLAAPNGLAGVPTFRAVVAADIPTLNQNTTGTAANITATSNSTLTTLSVLSLPGSQVTGNISGNAANVTGTVAVANGGTGLTTTPANGALDIGNGVGFTRTTLTAGTNVSITNAAGSITINSSNPGGTVTSVAALTLGTTGTDLSSTVATSTTTPVITLNVPTASALNRGALSAADWTTFNNKGSGTITSVTATSPVTSTGGTTPVIAMPAATTSVSGYLTSTDWTTFNNKGSGTVTAVSVVSANGFAGSSSGGATPALTLSTSITGVIKGNGTAISAATVGTDYSVGTSALATGILKSTTTTGALSIAVAADFPTLNQSTTGSAATLTTTRAIYGNNFDGSAALTQVIASTYGGTGNGFAKLSGPATTEKTFTLPNASATILTDNAAVTVLQGGTGATTASGARTNLGLVIGTDVLAPTGSAASLTSFPTFNQNTTGTAANVTGTVAIINGGTGQTTANTAFNALAPSQTSNSGKYLTTDGTNTSWATIAAGSNTTAFAFAWFLK